MADLGGGSLELVRVADGMADGASTLPLGTLRLPDYRPDQRKADAGRADMKKAIDKIIRKAGWDIAAAPSDAGSALYLVGGTWRAMAVYAMALRRPSPERPAWFRTGCGEPRRNWRKRLRQAKAMR